MLSCVTSPEIEAPVDGNLEDPADTLADVFSIHHLVWLARNGLVNDYPYALGPFPGTLDFGDTGKFDMRIREDLERWGIIDGGALHPDAEFLFNSILGSSEWMLWGTVLLHSLKTNATAEFNFDEDIFGLRHAVRDIPRVTFAIAVTEREIITAVNAPPALIFDRFPRTRDVHVQVGEILHDMLDPEHNWQPWDGNQLTLTASAAKAMATNPAASKIVNGDEEDDHIAAQTDATESALLELEVPSYESKAFSKLMSAPTSASVQASIDYNSDRGMITASYCLGVTFFDGKGIVVSYPVGKSEKTRLLYYVPGDEKGFADGVKAMLDLAKLEST